MIKYNRKPEAWFFFWEEFKMHPKDSLLQFDQWMQAMEKRVWVATFNLLSIVYADDKLLLLIFFFSL